jgi:hypothetical protein
MNFADLTDTDFTFQCAVANDKCDHWEYDFSVERWDDKYCRNMSQFEIEQLKANCKGILNAINALQGGC